MVEWFGAREFFLSMAAAGLLVFLGYIWLFKIACGKVFKSVIVLMLCFYCAICVMGWLVLKSAGVF